MRNETIAQKAASAFETTSTTMGLLGLIPGVGTLAGVAGISTDAGAKVARATEHRNRWYMLGAKMHEVAIQAAISEK